MKISRVAIGAAKLCVGSVAAHSVFSHPPDPIQLHVQGPDPVKLATLPVLQRPVWAPESSLTIVP